MSNYLKDLEDSRLLFKTFCDGLMYGLFFYHGETLHRVVSIEGLDDTVNGAYPIKECRPCLRSMSSMTEGEKEEFIRYAGYEVEESVNGRHYEYYLKDYVGTPESPTCNYDSIDWLNSHHFDYRGLIGKGLAIEAPEGMYKTD